MTNIAGLSFPTPTLDITGLLSNTWFYIFIIGFLFIIAGVIMGVILWRRMWNKTVIIFENVSGLGSQVAKRYRARTHSLGTGGSEILKLLNGDYVSAYGRKMGPNQYWFAKAGDGYLINFTMTDVDTELARMGIKLHNPDVRMYHTAKDRMAKDTYGKTGFLEKYGPTLIMLVLVIICFIGIYVIYGKLADLAASNAVSSQALANAMSALAQSQTINHGAVVGTGLVPAG